MKNEKIRFKDLIAYEKAKMHPLMFAMTYIVTPVYLVITLLLIGAFAVFMEVDEHKYFVHGLLCLGAFVLITVILLVCVPLARKKVISAELQRYDFDTSKEEVLEQYDFSTEDISLKFDRNGMYFNDKLFYYNHLHKTVVTTNECKRIGIYLQFALTEEQYVMLYVNPTTLKMLECLEIKLDNHQVLDYIVSNPREAFVQIFSKGANLCS